MSPTNKLTEFWQELKRRKVIKANAMYAATAFIIMEAADIILPRLGLPDWTVTLVIVLLIVGFPISIILSWIFDVSSEGITKTESLEEGSEEASPQSPKKRKLRGSDIVIAVMFVAVCILLYPKVFNKDKFENIRQEDGRISIAVMPFQNMTNDTLWNVWQVGIQNELISNLSNSTELSIRQYQTMQEILHNSDQVNSASFTPAVAGEISRKLDANTFIQGGIKSVGRQFRLNVQLVDAQSEEIFKTFQVEGSSEEDMFLLADSLSRMVRNYLEIKVLNQDLEYDLRSENATYSAEAYRYYIQGLNSYFMGDNQSAIERLNRTIDIDPGFFPAYNWLLEVYERLGFLSQDYEQIEHAKQLLDILLHWENDELSRMEQLSFKMIRSKYIDKNPQDYIRQCKQMLEFDPQQRIIWFNLGRAYSSIKQYEQAIEAFEQSFEISKQWELNREWVKTYVNLGEAYHNIGNHKQEAEVFKEGFSKFSDHHELNRRLALCAFSRGDTVEGLTYFAPYKTNRQQEIFWTDTEVDHRLSHIYGDAGYHEQAEALWRTTVQTEPNSYYHKRCFAEFLILKEVNIDDGLELVNEILDFNPDYYDILYFKGWALYKQGHPEEALEILNMAWDKRLTYRHSHFLAIQEVEKALSDQGR